MAIWAASVLLACSTRSSPPKPELTSSTADVETAARELVAIARPCETAEVAALFDREAFVRLVEQRAPRDRSTIRVVERFTSIAANELCASVAGADEVRLLRVRAIDGEPRAVIRKVTATGFGYFDVRTRGAKLLDVYSHNNGTWMSQETADALLVPGADDPKVAIAVNQIVSLDRRGKHADALAALDALPEPTRNTRSLQNLRVAIAGRVSVDAYEQALEEHARRFPDDKPTPFTAMNRAFLRGELDGVLAQIDAIDAAVGGDPFLETIRASVLVQRGGPGDLERAAARVERAIAAEPRLSMPRFVKLGVAMARAQWPAAIATLDGIADDLGIALTEEQIRGLPNAAAFLATPAYRAWRTRHP